MRVRATQKGFYGDQLREVGGDPFDIPDDEKLGSWMEEATDELPEVGEDQAIVKLDSMTFDALKELADAEGLELDTGLNKEAVIDAIFEHRRSKMIDDDQKGEGEE